VKRTGREGGQGIIETMSEVSEAVTIRRLPRGEARPARIVVRGSDRQGDSDRLGVRLTAGETEAFEAGTLVEIDAVQALYLGEVVGRQQDSLVTVAVEHSIDRAALAEMEKAWEPA
jgi:hypothetical protein